MVKLAEDTCDSLALARAIEVEKDLVQLSCEQTSVDKVMVRHDSASEVAVLSIVLSALEVAIALGPFFFESFELIENSTLFEAIMVGDVKVEPLVTRASMEIDPPLDSTLG